MHIVINNQLGFTTAPEAARTSVYPTDVAKMVQAPIFHVNGDDPEACVRAARLAFGFRQAFHKDVVIDMVCYRRHGHNEGDDPSYTQPIMYAAHRGQAVGAQALHRVAGPPGRHLPRGGGAGPRRLLGPAAAPPSTRPGPRRRRRAVLHPVLPEYAVPDLDARAGPTGVDASLLSRLAETVRSVPEGFVIHPKLARQFEQRDKMVADGEIDWALGEALAFGSLLVEGTNVRLTGQDTRRGTFSQRHAVLVDHTNGREHVPLAGLGPGRFTVRDSLLSEYACVGFEYGYSVEAIDDLVAWEAQFGDFWNGAEIIVDNFLVAAEDKWGQKSGLVLLLPHGYEGQGPEHSSARIERFLALCARGNMRVTEPTTAAQYFHLLRSQVRDDPAPSPGRVHPEVAAAVPPGPLAGRPPSPPAPSPRCSTTRPPAREGFDPAAVSPGGAVQRARSPTTPWAGATSSASAGSRWRWCGSSSSTPGPTPSVARRPRALRRTPTRWSGCRRSPRTWGRGTSSTAGSTGCCARRHALRHVSRAESASPASGSAALHRLEQDDLLDRAVGPVGS